MTSGVVLYQTMSADTAWQVKRRNPECHKPGFQVFSFHHRG